MSLDRRNTSAYLQTLFTATGKSYRDAEAATGVPLATISRIVRGRTQNPSVDAVAALVAYLGGSMDELANYSAGDPITLSDDHPDRDPWAEVERARLAHIAVLNDRIRGQRRTIIILALLLGAVLAWFIWDLTHPDVGLIRLMQKTGYIGRVS